MNLQNKYCSSYFGAPNYIDKGIIEKQKYLFILFLRIGNVVVIALTKNHDGRIEQLVKKKKDCSLLLSASVSTPIETRRLFWSKLRPYTYGNKRKHKYCISDDALIDIINKNDSDLHFPCGGEYANHLNRTKKSPTKLIQSVNEKGENECHFILQGTAMPSLGSSQQSNSQNKEN